MFFYVLAKTKAIWRTQAVWKQQQKNCGITLKEPPLPQMDQEGVKEDYEKWQINADCILGDAHKVHLNTAQSKQIG